MRSEIAAVFNGLRDERAEIAVMFNGLRDEHAKIAVMFNRLYSAEEIIAGSKVSEGSDPVFFCNFSRNH